MLSFFFLAFDSYIYFYLIPSSNMYTFRVHIGKHKFTAVIFWTSEDRGNAEETGIDKIKLPLDVAESSEIIINKWNSCHFSIVKEFRIR